MKKFLLFFLLCSTVILYASDFRWLVKSNANSITLTLEIIKNTTVYRDGMIFSIKDADGNIIFEINAPQIRKLINDGVISGGMIPKVLGCISAINGGVERVHIIDGRIPHSILLEIFTDKGIGTMITK